VAGRSRRAALPMLTVEVLRRVFVAALALIAFPALCLAALGSSGEVVEIPVLAAGDQTALPVAQISGRTGLASNIDPRTGLHPVYKLRPEPYGDGGRIPVTLDDLLALAVEHNYGVQGQALSVESSRYDVDKTYYVFDSSLAGSLSYSKRSFGTAGAGVGDDLASEGIVATFDFDMPFDNGDNFSVGYDVDRSRFDGIGGATDTSFGSGLNIGYSHPLLRGAGRHLNLIPRYQASNNLELQEFTLDGNYQDVRKAILDAYFLAVAARRTIDVRTASLDRALLQLERAVERYKVGLSIQADVLQAENSVLQQRAALLQSYEDYDTLLDQLTTIIGLPQEYAITVNPDEALLGLDENYDPTLPDDLWDMVAANSTDLFALSTQLANLLLRCEQLENALKPQLDLSASYGRTGEDAALGSALTGLENQSYNIGLTFRTTPGERLAKADVAQNQIELESTQLQVKDTELQLKTRLRDLQRDLSIKLRQIDLARSNVLVTQQTLDIVTERHNVGLATALNVIEAQEDVLLAELQLLNAQVDYQQSYREILLLAGLI
nr:TolC family protein [bacterium]